MLHCSQQQLFVSYVEEDSTILKTEANGKTLFSDVPTIQDLTTGPNKTRQSPLSLTSDPSTSLEEEATGLRPIFELNSTLGENPSDFSVTTDLCRSIEEDPFRVSVDSLGSERSPKPLKKNVSVSGNTDEYKHGSRHKESTFDEFLRYSGRYRPKLGEMDKYKGKSHSKPKPYYRNNPKQCDT